MIDEPGRYIERFLEAGCDSITFHVEIDEPIEPTLAADPRGRPGGRAWRSSRRRRCPGARRRTASSSTSCS